MKLLIFQYLAILTVLATEVAGLKPGGKSGGKSGGSSGGSFGGSSGGGSSGRSSSGSATGSSAGPTSPRSGSVSQAGNYNFPPDSRGYTKGGYGGFSGPPPPYSYATTRSTYTNYQPTYAGGYGLQNRRSGWVGAYNPGLLYWAIVPSFFYLGFHSMYHRYNQNDGSYYAPELSVSAGDGHNVVVNGTEHTSEEDNYYYTFNMTTGYTYAMADHGFFATSDHNAHPADLAFRMTFSHIIEWNDANQNGFYDDGEAILAVTPLASLPWEPMTPVVKSSPTNATINYYEVATVARNVTRGGSGGTPFDVYLTWDWSNLQVNMTQGVPIQPNSLRYNVTLAGYPTPPAPNTRLAIAQWITLPTNITLMLDVNTTTPLDMAQQIKSNQTYGASIGDFNEARLEYEPTVNITRVTQPPNNISAAADVNTNTWIWGDRQQQATLLVVSLPLSSSSPQLSGFSFLDVNVLSAEAAEAAASEAGDPVAAASMAIPTKSMLFVVLTASCASFLLV